MCTSTSLSIHDGFACATDSLSMHDGRLAIFCDVILCDLIMEPLLAPALASIENHRTEIKWRNASFYKVR